MAWREDGIGGYSRIACMPRRACLQGAGIDLRPMQSIYMFPTLVIFAEGKGIAGAKALIEAGSDAHGLDLYFRQDVRLYYRVSHLAADGSCL